ncbi:Yer119cp like amino acid transporter [Nosema bombycis CQ1]|uniref:Yer119cp like amino acid transporter n=1 Tax=Nosema bombycis (strain CQ1 / CVCC 102059) TaxID=578461 RepID=R0LZG4_NOSB1|nr:Yer119cp like amino acid transporter [Nosema bombycis CQ1]|eukprot:EOB11199.1 Yer119cp like amino acid transporter [Nosema bombycis CQ1]
MTKGVSVFSSVTALWSTLFGVGIYFTPKAFAKSGILYASLQLLGVGGISFISILVLFILSYEEIIKQSEIKKEEDMPLNTCSISIQDKDIKTEVKYVQENQVMAVKPDDGIRLSYAGLGKSLQKWLGVVIDLVIMMTAFSKVLFYQKFISLISTSLLGHSVVDSIGFNPYYIFVVLYGLIILSGGQFKNLQSIDWLSKISFASIAVNCLIVGAMNFILVDFKSAHITNPTKNVSLSVISTFIFALFCQNNVVEIFNNMRDKNVKNLILVAAAVPLGACVFYAIMGVTGSMLFGDYMPNEDIISILANENSEIVKHLFDKNSKFYCIHFLVPCVAIIGLIITSIYSCLL